MFTDSKHMEAMDFSVKKYRQEAGYRSARAFFQYIADKATLGFNYSYYTRIESGDVIPSIGIIKQLASFFPGKLGEGLVIEYCASIFPEYTHLFDKKNTLVSTVPEQASSLPFAYGQVELTLRQIGILIKSKGHYHAFLILTLARYQLSLEQLKECLGEQVEEILIDLKEVRIAYQDEQGYWKTFSNEFRFPKAYCNELEKAYKQLDQWDHCLDQEFKFKPLKRKFFFRRTSPKFITLILSLLNHTDELVRTSEEVDEKLNDEVFMLEYRLGVGKLAG